MMELGQMLLPYIESGNKEQLIKMGASLGVAFSAYTALTGYFGKGTLGKGTTEGQRPLKTFKDPVECVQHDAILNDAFLTLQQYRKLDKYLFGKTIQTVDQLLFLEQGLLQKQFPPSRSDKTKGWALFRLSLNKLNEFQHMVRTTMKNEHAVVVNILIKKIYEQLQKHILNVLHLCSRFNPNDWLKMASKEVDEAVRRMEHEHRTSATSKVRRRHLTEKWAHGAGRVPQHVAPGAPAPTVEPVASPPPVAEQVAPPVAPLTSPLVENA